MNKKPKNIKEWSNLANKVAKILDCEVIGFNPSIHLIEKGYNTGFQISTSIANKIINLIK